MDSDNSRTLGRYRLLDEIGRGGMAVVYRAFDTSLKRDVALKLLHSHLVTHKEARERFEREAHSVAKLHHSSLVEVYDYSETENDEVFIVMELVDGTTLRKFLEQRKGRPLLAEAAALIVREIFVALGLAHAQGIVHRDVKPENILISSAGELKLSDFGIAYLAGIGQMTVTGQILGSPTYMSPEHIERATVDARADIFSVGTLLYEMAVGILPFQGNNPHQIIKRVVEGYYDHPLSVAPIVGHGVSSVIVKCLQQDPERRYKTAEDAVIDLDNVLSQMGISSPAGALTEFFCNPDDWEDEHRKQVVPRILQLGNTARKTRQLPEAMNHFNRVLAIEPGNESALDAVNGLSRRRQFKRGLERIGVVAVSIFIVALLSWLVLRDWSIETGNTAKEDISIGSERIGLSQGDAESIGARPDTSAPKNSSQETVRDNIVIIEKKDTDISTDSGADQSRTAVNAGSKPKQRPHKKKDLPLVKRKVVFNPHPMRVEVLIDGTDRFVYKTTNRSRELSIGEHSVKFIPEDDRLQSLAKDFDIKEGVGPLTIGARLKWKPAKLLVRSNVDTVVAVVGRSSGKTNVPFLVPVKKGPQEKIKVLISARGFRPISRQVTINAGDVAEVVVHLEKGQQ